MLAILIWVLVPLHAVVVMTRMKRKTTIMSLLAVLMLFMAVPMQMAAKKIKFGQYVVYSGGIENDLPKGEGELTIVSKDNVYKKNALFKGVFDGYKISGSLELRSKGYYPSFKGTAELEISPDSSTVKVKVITGTLTAQLKENGSIDDYPITKDDNLVISCIPTENGIHITSTRFSGKERLTNTRYVKLKPKIMPSIMYGSFYYLENDVRNNMELNGDLKWYAQRTLSFDYSSCKLKTLEYYETILLEKVGAIVTIRQDGTEELSYSNGSSFTYKRQDGDDKIICFKVNYNGNILSRKTDGGITTYTTKDGKEYVAFQYSTKGDLINIPCKEVKQSYDKNSVFSSLWLNLFEGTAGQLAFKAYKQDVQAMYDLGMAYHEGKGVNKNDERALSWFEKAAAAGHTDAINISKTLKLEMYEKERSLHMQAISTNPTSKVFNSAIAFFIDNNKKEEALKVLETYANSGINDDIKNYSDFLVERFDEMESGKDYYWILHLLPKEKERRTRNAEIQSHIDRANQLQAKYAKKYGAAHTKKLCSEGCLSVGMPIGFIKEFVSDSKQQLDSPYALWWSLEQYQPTVTDMMQFGRFVQVYHYNACHIWVLNGKVVAFSKSKFCLSFDELREILERKKDKMRVTGDRELWRPEFD